MKVKGIMWLGGMVLLGACESNGAESASEPTMSAGDEVAMTSSENTAAEQDIVETASANGSFQTLVAAVQAAGLVETLQGSGPYTVFAPTDAAFAELPPGTVEDLLKPENREKLRAILTYHVVPGEVTSAEVVNATEAPTVQGSELPIAVEGGSVKVGEAKVTQADIECSNGVIHVIDKVLLPPT